MSIVPEFFNEIMNHYEIIKLRFPNHSISCKALDNRYVIGAGRQKRLLNYTDEQLSIIENLNEQHSNKYTHTHAINSDGSTTQLNPFSMLVNDKNRFKGWQCDIGLENLVFHYNGAIKRANCQPTEPNYGNWRTGEYNLPTNSVICDKEKCGAVTEIAVSKRKT
jgi:hypothetical protein